MAQSQPRVGGADGPRPWKNLHALSRSYVEDKCFLLLLLRRADAQSLTRTHLEREDGSTTALNKKKQRADR